MSQVRKGNRILTIEPHRVDDYVARGYDHIDEESGEVIKKGDPVSLADFKSCLLYTLTLPTTERV